MTKRISIFPEPENLLQEKLIGESHEYNLHRLLPEQITKLIGLKYNADPIRLIRQLSLELVESNNELQQLTRNKFIREQKLFKLCNEYGNLSRLEIDQKMAEIEIEEKYHERPLAPQEIPLIEHAKGSKSPSPTKELSHTPTKEVARKSPPPKTSTKEAKKSPPQKSSTKETKKSPTPPNTSTKEVSKRSPPKTSRSNSVNTEKAPEISPSVSGLSSLSALSNKWFHSTDDLTKSSRSASVSNMFPIFKSERSVRVPVELDNFTQSDRVPVELDNFTKSETLPSSPSEDVNVDKYGFFIDSIGRESRDDDKEDAPKETQSEVSPAILINKPQSVTLINQLKQISQKHDSINLQYEQQWDSLIHDIRRDFLQFLRNSDLSQMNNVEMIGVKGLNLLKLDAYSKTSYYSKLIKLVNKFGILPKYRPYLWLELSGAKNLKVNGEYQQLLLEVQNPNIEVSEYVKQIDLDLHRTLPLNYHFNNLVELKPGPNFYKLQRILYAFVVHRSDIGYFQGMNKIIGNLLLLLSKNNEDNDSKLEEEDIFWIFVGLIEEILPKYRDDSADVSDQVYFNSLLNIKIDQSIVKIYLARYLPTLYAHFEKLSLDVEVITMNWWLTLFIDLKFMDLDIWFKLFENFLIDNYIEENEEHPSPSFSLDDFDQQDRSAIKLISLLLSIFKVLEAHLLGMADSDEIYGFLSSNNNKHGELRLLIKYGDLMKSHRLFMGRIKVGEVNRLRASVASESL